VLTRAVDWALLLVRLLELGADTDDDEGEGGSERGRHTDLRCGGAGGRVRKKLGKPDRTDAARLSDGVGQLGLQETVGQVQVPLVWTVTPQVLPLPFGLATRTWALG
jgi:hypothetical protein